ncbi:metallophosphoesterase [bacterium]|nr:metallophosphoesterase [bacterium]
MRKKAYKKEKKESFFQKIFNIMLTLFIAFAISNQMSTAANNNLRLAQVSDVHFSTFEENTSYKFLKKSPQLLDDVVFQINTSGPYDFVMFTGDLVNKPKSSELLKFISHASLLNCPWYAINGNHDIAIDGPLTKNEFRKILNSHNRFMSNSELYYSFSPKKGYRVICLDSIIDYKLTSNGEINKEQLDWLKEQLDKYRKDVIILCTHVPIEEPYPSANHKLNNDDELKKLLRNYTNPIIVLQGHYHCVRAKQKDNIIYISSPSLVTFPNAFRVININSNKKRTVVDVFLKETNLKDVQSRSKLRLFGVESLYGNDFDRNTTFEIKNNKE